MSATKELTRKINEPTNGAKNAIEMSMPFMMRVTFQGTSDLLFHRWNVEAIEEKGKSKKNSAAKKTDDLESYVYRNDKGELCIPGEYFRMACIGAAKFKPDPRSPRKSAMDLYKAAIVILSPLCSLGTKEWSYEDKRRVVIQRSGINRVRPAMKIGWKCACEFMIQLPEYVDQGEFIETLNYAGRIVGVGDFRPSYGRFVVKNFDLIKE